jgi:hypothetical protein
MAQFTAENVEYVLSLNKNNQYFYVVDLIFKAICEVNNNIKKY